MDLENSERSLVMKRLKAKNKGNKRQNIPFIDKVEMEKVFRTILCLQLLILIFFSCILPGCGKKGPPVPPQKELISSGAKGSFAFQSKTTPAEADCKDYPVVYNHVVDFSLQ